MVEQAPPRPQGYFVNLGAIALLELLGSIPRAHQDYEIVKDSARALLGIAIGMRVDENAPQIGAAPDFFLAARAELERVATTPIAGHKPYDEHNVYQTKIVGELREPRMLPKNVSDDIEKGHRLLSQLFTSDALLH